MAGRKIASTVGKKIGKIISPEDAAKRLKGRKRKLQTGPKADQKKLKDMQAAGMVKRQSPLKSKKAKLAEEYDGLTAGAKRAERLKGNKSKFFSVFKDRGMTPMKSGGSLKMVKKNGKKVPFYAADGIGKMSKGGSISKEMGEDRTSVPAEYSAKAQSKKKKKMGGGKVYKRKHSGKVIKNNMSGQDLVNACYD